MATLQYVMGQGGNPVAGGARPQLIDAKRILAAYDLNEAMLSELREASVGIPVADLVAALYLWLENFPEYQQFFANPEVLKRVQKLQEKYWARFLDASIDNEYIESRRHVGQVHARIKLGIHIYFAAMNFCVSWLRQAIVSKGQPADRTLRVLDTLDRLAQIDSAIAIDAIATEHGKIIAQQSRSLMELSTPAIKLWDGIVLLPLIGVIDSLRAGQVKEGLLNAIVNTEAQIAILDVTGVPVIDTYLAQHLIQTVTAARMLGAEVIFTGFTPEAAQTLSRLGMELADMQTAGSLRLGLAKAFRRTGWRIGKEPA